MNIDLRFRTIAAITSVALVLTSRTADHRAYGQNPLFPNTQATYYSPYGQGVYGRYGNSINLPSGFGNTQPNFFRPTSALQYSYRTSSYGIYNSPYNYAGNYIQNTGNGSYYHPLGY